MSDETPTPARARKPRPQRGAMEALLRIVHTLEVCALAFGALAAWGVSRDWPQPVAFGAVALLLILSMRVLGRPWGWIVSLVAQIAVGLLVLVEVVWGLVALVFIILWIFCFVKARGIEHRRLAAGLDPRGAPGT
ncbi:DUF4233 domain-containing protein [Agrococcus sp. Marseille-P2731]|uniref:DUF4233 domain-containing protein n=1 Tax=Agrococcus sp. Marseille-P2731 TaxID=1841862 RepID=UPI0009303106|nr:DUF4233 domain-containing protein [Agrococcus sp. Marseille-P2731]